MIKGVLECRQGILLASAGALLHNLGKVSSQFVGSKVPPKWAKDYKYQHICKLFVEDVDCLGRGSQLTSNKEWKKLYDKIKSSPDNRQPIAPGTLNALKTPVAKLPKPFEDRFGSSGPGGGAGPIPYRVGDIIEYLGQGEKIYPALFRDLFGFSSLLTHLMNLCHHGASGGEKDDISSLQQRLPLCLATPCGYEKPAPDLAEYDRIKEDVERVIQQFLSGPKDPFSLSEFARRLEPLLRRVPADTRRGLNDVTVWDIGHAGMAFLKAGIWSAAKNPGLTHDDLIDRRSPQSPRWMNEKFPRWRLWRVGLDGPAYLADAVSVADLRVRQRKLRAYLDAVRRFAEEIYPVATEVYRDENGAIFIFPDWVGGSAEYSAFCKLYGHVFSGEKWENSGAEKEAGQIKKEAQWPPEEKSELSLPEVFALRPTAELSGDNYHNHPESRGRSCCKANLTGGYIGDKVEEWLKKPLPAEPVPEAYAGEVKTDLCSSCGVRPAGGGADLVPEEERKLYRPAKARERKICCVCMRERGRIAEEWWKKKPFSTVWVDEAADVNGRVALVVGKFGVEKMLEDLVYPSVKGKQWNDWLRRGAHLYGAPSDSFARFRRVWETTARFWREVAPPEETFPAGEKSPAEEKKFWAGWRDSLAASLAVRNLGGEAARRRLLLRLRPSGGQGKEESFGPFHAYELEAGGVKIGVACVDPGEGEFVTIENVGYLARQFGAPEKVAGDPCAAAACVQNWLNRKGEEFCLREPTAYERPGEPVVENAILQSISFAPDIYHPVIPVLAEPRAFAVLVPGKAAFNLVRGIKKKYEQEMGKVRWRLPLTLGAVFFPRHTPLQVVLDAGWRLLKVRDAADAAPEQKAKAGTAKNPQLHPLGYAYFGDQADSFQHPQGKQWPAAVKLFVEVEGSGKELAWVVSTTAGDNRTFDVWYPWVKVEGPVQNRCLAFQDPQNPGSAWLHVMEIEEGDKIKFHPSTFDFVFLDHAGRRFELAYCRFSF